jgi:carboxypeptidase T
VKVASRLIAIIILGTILLEAGITGLASNSRGFTNPAATPTDEQPQTNQVGLPVTSVFDRSSPGQEILPGGYPFQVIRVYYHDRSQLASLASWLDIWEVQTDEQYLVAGVNQGEYQRLVAMGYGFEILPEETAALFAPHLSLPGQTSGIPGYACYRTVEETYASAQQLAQQHPDLVEWVDIGDSWQKQNGLGGYDLLVLRLTNRNLSLPKPKMFVMSSVHARELAPAELNTRFAEYLVNNYGVDPDVTWLLDYTEIHLLLQANPDGRKQAETGLFWRKNTNNNYCTGTDSRGADLNRNFSFQWGCCGGSSSLACSSTFRGASAASEPETQAIQNYLRSIFPDQRGPDLGDAAPADTPSIFFDLHSYSRLVLWPWGFTADAAPNGAALQTMGRKLGYFTTYWPEQAAALYPTDGTTDDFTYGELGVASFTLEMGSAFFEPCDSFENTVIPQNLPALLYAAKAARAPYQIPSGPDVTTLELSQPNVHAGQVLTLTATLDDSRYSSQGGSEPVQAIAGGEVYLDLPPGVTGAVPAGQLLPQDSAFDTPLETGTFELNSGSLAPGRHLVFVRGQDTYGNWGAITAAFLTVEGPQAGFTSSSPDVVGETTLFTDTSVGDNLDYLWEFGDGDTSHLVGDVSHIYSAPGAYSVTLTVSNTLGTNQAHEVVNILAPWMHLQPVLQDASPVP